MPEHRESVHDTERDLVIEDIRSHHMSRGLLDQIEITRQRLGLSASEFRILDFGCGRGEAVGWLRLRGYQAWGLEVDSKWAQFAKTSFGELNLDAEDLLRSSRDESLPYPPARFHFVFSNSVMEHVSDLDLATHQIAWLTASWGSGFHQFRAWRSCLEGHLNLPLVHWLPKTELRRWAIKLLLHLAIDPGWEVCKGKSLEKKVEFYYRFSIDETFYRSPKQYLAAFRRAGLAAAIGVLEHPRVSRGFRVKHLLAMPHVSGLVEKAISNFWTTIIFTRKRG